ncbi:MAG: alpha-glucosidase [Candidatus Nanopelagicales bacterium]|nr:alpha-glucosidase [Candidatus Nanopelagicales bacterium]
MSHWWKNAVVYQIYPRSFADSDGDGLGDIEGIISKLDYLADLGVDVLWLSPIYKSPQDDNGYDISDYQSIDPMFGSLEQLDRLIAEVHHRGMKLIMDLVVNHTSDEHPWFQESRDPDSAKRDWYWWRTSDDGPPNNWGSIFSGSAWQFDEQSQAYYLHLFTRKQPDLNWENPEVRGAVYAMMNWWLDRGVDGFRMDVINLISKAPGLPDGEVAPGELHADGSPYYANGPRLHEYLQEMNREVFAHRDADMLTVGETPGVSVEQAKLITDLDRLELDMVFQFEHMELDHGTTKWDHRRLELPELKQNLAKWQDGLAQAGWNSLYWNNHDQPRVVSRFGDTAYWYESATLLAAVLHLHKGTPYIYQGEELGMTNYAFAGIDQYRDVEAINYFREAVEGKGEDPATVLAAMQEVARDNARTPMQWTDGPQAGFTTGEPWLPVNPNHTRINAAAQVGDPHSVFSFYRRLIELRHKDPVVQHGSFELLLADDPVLWVFTRTLGSEQLLVVANLGNEVVDLPVDAHGETVIANYDEPVGDRLRAWEVRVVRRSVNGD